MQEKNEKKLKKRKETHRGQSRREGQEKLGASTSTVKGSFKSGFATKEGTSILSKLKRS